MQAKNATTGIARPGSMNFSAGNGRARNTGRHNPNAKHAAGRSRQAVASVVLEPEKFRREAEAQKTEKNKMAFLILFFEK